MKTLQDGITVEFLSAIKGHSEVFIKDTDPAERAGLGKQMQELIKNGHAVFLIQGDETRMVKDYDTERNEWIVVATPQDPPTGIVRHYRRRFDGRRSRVTVVPPMAGG